MAVPTCIKIVLVVLTLGVITCFVRVGTLEPMIANVDPPAFDTTACGACTTSSNTTCANVFNLGGAADANEARVCSRAGMICCCPHRDPAFRTVECIESYPSNPSTTCKCRYERVCGKSCYLQEGVVLLVVGIAGCITIFCVSVGAMWCHTSPRRPPPPTSNGH